MSDFAIFPIMIRGISAVLLSQHYSGFQRKRESVGLAHFYLEVVCIFHSLTFLSNFILSIQADFTLGTKEYWVSLKYLFNRSGHTLRIFTTRSATISSSVAVFKPSRKRRSTTFPPLSKIKKKTFFKKEILTSIHAILTLQLQVNPAMQKVKLPLSLGQIQGKISQTVHIIWVYLEKSKN